MSSKLMTSQLVVLRFDRDFAINPLLIASPDALFNLPDGFIMQSARLQEVETITATSTLALGEDGGGDADGYLVAVDPSTQNRCEGALLYESTDKRPLEHVVDSTKDGLLMTAAVANVVVGKVAVFVQGYQSY